MQLSISKIEKNRSYALNFLYISLPSLREREFLIRGKNERFRTALDGMLFAAIIIKISSFRSKEAR
jgi:hypothetical protein